MTLDELYRRKGEYTTKIEIFQQLLAQVNKELTIEINKKDETDRPVS